MSENAAGLSDWDKLKNEVKRLTRRVSVLEDRMSPPVEKALGHPPCRCGHSWGDHYAGATDDTALECVAVTSDGAWVCACGEYQSDIKTHPMTTARPGACDGSVEPARLQERLDNIGRWLHPGLWGAMDGRRGILLRILAGEQIEPPASARSTDWKDDTRWKADDE